VTDRIAIIGAGPVGMFAANALGRRGIPVTLFEASPELDDSPRAITYISPLLPDLDRWGVLDGMRGLGVVDRMGFNLHLVALDEILSFPFDDPDAAYAYNVFLGQGDVCAIAQDALGSLPDVELRRGHRLTTLEQDASGVDLTFDRLDGSTVRERFSWVVGADGGRGTTRSQIGATLEGFTWDEQLVATNVRYDFPAHGFFPTQLYAHPEYGCVVGLIDRTNLWRVTFQESPDLPESGLPERIDAFYRGLIGDALGEYELTAYRKYAIHQRTASTMRVGRVLLAGDAAHLTNPTGGQGLISGTYDVAALEEALTAVLGGSADERVLDAYSDGRRTAFLTTGSPIGTNFKKIVYDKAGDVEWVREHTQVLRELAATPEGRRAFHAGADQQRTHPVRDVEEAAA